MPAPCCLRWAGALPRPPECVTLDGVTLPVGKRYLLKGLLCVFVIMLTVPAALGGECAIRRGVPGDGVSRALIADQVVEAVLEAKTSTNSPVYEAVFRVSKVYKKYRGPRRVKKNRSVSLPFRKIGAEGADGCLVAAELQLKRKYFLFLSGSGDSKEPLQNIAPPLPSTKRIKRRIKNTICKECAKTPSVGQLRDDSVVRGHSANLTCTFDGNPSPVVTWTKDGKPVDLSLSSNIRIYTRRVRIRPRTRRPRRRRRRRESRRRTDDEGSNAKRRRKSRRKKSSRGRARPVRVISTLAIESSKDSDAGLYSCVGKSVLGESSTRAGLSVVPPLDPGIVHPCPYDSYCLNGGTCMFFKHFGEFVCQCAEGFKGQRCQEKEVFPSFREHNCRGPLQLLSPSRGLRCPRNQPLFLWEILQQSLAASKQKVSPWTKAHHLTWSPVHITGINLGSSRNRSHFHHFPHLGNPSNENDLANFPFYLKDHFFSPQVNERRKGQLQPPLRSVFDSDNMLNSSLEGSFENTSHESVFFHLADPDEHFFSNNTKISIRPPQPNSWAIAQTTSPQTSGFEGNHSNNQTVSELFSLLVNNNLQFTEREKLPFSFKHSQASEVHPIRHQHDNKLMRPRTPTRWPDKWPFGAHSSYSKQHPRQSYAYPTSVTPVAGDQAGNFSFNGNMRSSG